MSETSEDRLRRFFKRYATASLEGDMEAILGAHADRFIETAPDAFMAWKVDAQDYREAVAKGYRQMRDELGVSGLEVDLTEIREVAPYHYLAEALWKMDYGGAKKGLSRSEFKVSYIVRTVSDPCILAQMAHDRRNAFRTETA